MRTNAPRHLNRPTTTSRRSVLGLLLLSGGLVGTGAGAYSYLTASTPAEAARPEPAAPFTVAAGAASTPIKAPAKKPGKNTVSIPSLSLELPFIGTGTTGPGAGRMVIPEAPEIAWLKSTSPLTATKGTTFLAGHVDHADGSLAPMSKISGVAPGAAVFTVDADGTLRSWRVTSLATYIKTKLPTGLFTTTGPRTLALATCGGPVITLPDGSLNYRDNTVVTAVPA